MKCLCLLCRIPSTTYEPTAMELLPQEMHLLVMLVSFCLISLHPTSLNCICQYIKLDMQAVKLKFCLLEIYYGKPKSSSPPVGHIYSDGWLAGAAGLMFSGTLADWLCGAVADLDSWLAEVTPVSHVLLALPPSKLVIFWRFIATLKGI